MGAHQVSFIVEYSRFKIVVKTTHILHNLLNSSHLACNSYSPGLLSKHYTKEIKRKKKQWTTNQAMRLIACMVLSSIACFTFRHIFWFPASLSSSQQTIDFKYSYLNITTICISLPTGDLYFLKILLFTICVVPVAQGQMVFNF